MVKKYMLSGDRMWHNDAHGKYVAVEDYEAIVAERDGFNAAWQNACERGDIAAQRLHNADACIDAISRALRGEGVNDQYEAWDQIVKFVAEYRTNSANEK